MKNKINNKPNHLRRDLDILYVPTDYDRRIFKKFIDLKLLSISFLNRYNFARGQHCIGYVKR